MSLPSKGEPGAIFCRKGASSEADQGELGRGNTTAGSALTSSRDGVGSSTSDLSCRGSVRPASKDLNTGKSGYK